MRLVSFTCFSVSEHCEFGRHLKYPSQYIFLHRIHLAKYSHICHSDEVLDKSFHFGQLSAQLYKNPYESKEYNRALLQNDYFILLESSEAWNHALPWKWKKKKTSIIPICFLYILLFLKTNDVKHKYDQLIFDKGAKEMECRNIILFNRWCWNSQTSTCKINLDTDLNTLNIN